MHPDFSYFAAKVGVPHLQYLASPGLLGEDLLLATKQYAQALRTFCSSVNHSRRLEIVSRAAGMKDWHQLQTLAQRLIDRSEGMVVGGPDPLTPLTRALALLTRPPNDRPPRDEEIAGLEQMVNGLSATAPLQLAEARSVVASVIGASSWNDLLDPEARSGPRALYEFRIDDDADGGEGVFVRSSKCQSLAFELDHYFLGYRGLPEEEKPVARGHVERLVAEHPDFLEGLNAQAIIRLDQGDARGAVRQFRDTLKKAEALMPPTFKGVVHSGQPSNRFYQSVVYGLVESRIKARSTIKPTISLIRRQLRLDPDDRVGFRFFLPPLLLADCQFTAAENAAEQMAERDESTGQIALIRSAVAALNNDQMERAVAFFLEAVFEWPGIKLFFDVDLEGDFDSPDLTRLRRPDPAATHLQLMAITDTNGWLFEAYQRILAMPSVKEAEIHLEKVFKADLETLRPTWPMEVRHVAGRLAYSNVLRQEVAHLRDASAKFKPPS